VVNTAITNVGLRVTAIRRATDTIGGPCPSSTSTWSPLTAWSNVTGPWGNTINILQHLAQPTLNQEMCEKAYLCHKCLLLNNLCFCSMKTKKARSCGPTVDPSSTKFVKVN
jgi:hypothetical protein